MPNGPVGAALCGPFRVGEDFGSGFQGRCPAPAGLLAGAPSGLRPRPAAQFPGRQIAIRGGSPKLLAAIRKASARNRVAVAVNGVFRLSVGDNGAIWEKHQVRGRQAEDFASLYDLLSRRPEQPVTFSWFDTAKQPERRKPNPAAQGATLRF